MNRRDRERRFAALKAMSCLCCGRSPVDIHHLNAGGHAGQKRRGDECTIPLCAWHHRGDPMNGYTATQMGATFGPSLARQSKAFHALYGTDDRLLELANQRIELTTGGA